MEDLPIAQKREQLSISTAAHVAGLMALRAEHIRYGQPLPTVAELSQLALQELVDRRSGAVTEERELAFAA